jgi:serine/threonine protein phosphatase 1
VATIAIGDVHGNFAALDDLLRRLRPRLESTDVVVFLGDYIDRGPDTRQCIDLILALEAERYVEVVGLLGNHGDWLLRTRGDFRNHTWLLATDPFVTIRSYSPQAADAMPAAHLAWFERLRASHHTADSFCSHGGVDPKIDDLSEQDRHALVCGGTGFPERYDGRDTVIYGHHNNAVLNADGWPMPAISGRTIGIDTISHGVLTAVRMPGAEIVQSARFARRHP